MWLKGKGVRGSRRGRRGPADGREGKDLLLFPTRLGALRRGSAGARRPVSGPVQRVTPLRGPPDLVEVDGVEDVPTPGLCYRLDPSRLGRLCEVGGCSEVGSGGLCVGPPSRDGRGSGRNRRPVPRSGVNLWSAERTPCVPRGPTETLGVVFVSGHRNAGRARTRGSVLLSQCLSDGPCTTPYLTGCRRNPTSPGSGHCR